MHLNNLLAATLMVGLVACTSKPIYPTISLPMPSQAATQLLTTTAPELTPTLTAMPAPLRLLTICLGREPTSLFYYDANSTAARDVLAAIYDGPVDVQNYLPHSVIVEKLPSLADGDAILQPVSVKTGDLIVDSSGNVVNFEEGVEYRPSGCTQKSCAQKYSGDQSVEMDQLVLHFKLMSGITWSDGAALTSADSVYSYKIALSLYPAAQPELVQRTQSYQALDESSVEWVGLPGYQDGHYNDKFFTPLPQHTWNAYKVEELRTADVSTRKPLGWGPYIIDEWISGDHISLHKNPLYFRATEDLPHFDNLVYRFIDNGDDALSALMAGECDVIDQTAMLDPQNPRLSELQNTGKVKTFYQNDAAWEQITFGIAPYDSQREQIFALKEVRQAVAMCIDRGELVADLPSGEQLLMDSYVPATHPLYNPGVQQYDFDLQKATALLESVGWLDADNNPATPRIAQGVTGVQDGTLFEIEYLVSSDAKPQSDSLAIQKMLQQCGIRTNIITQQPQQYLASGPDGPIFGRSFEIAQFAWSASLEPPCYLFLTGEIPGPYPDYPKGWGGVNASGFTNPDYDQACSNALFTLTDNPQHRIEHFQAQKIFSEELPALPLYLHYNVTVTRPDLCGFTSTSAVDSPLWNLETLDYGSGCS